MTVVRSVKLKVKRELKGFTKSNDGSKTISDNIKTKFKKIIFKTKAKVKTTDLKTKTKPMLQPLCFKRKIRH